jgi:hypothetical protein
VLRRLLPRFVWTQRLPETGGWMSISENRKDPVEAARHQTLFREVNERLRTLNEAFESVMRDSEFICECANTNCMEHVILTISEYEAVRRVPTRFVVLPGHVFPEVERVAEEHDGYFVVEKFGEAGKAAVRLDSRSRRG